MECEYGVRLTLLLADSMKSLLLGVMMFSVNLIPGETITYVREEPEPAYRVVTAEVTAYSEVDSCHYKNCAMATGNRAYIGAVACPRSIELYTRVVIDGKPYICEDRTHKDYDGRFDIFMGYGKENYKKALTFGKQTKEVQVLPKGVWTQEEHGGSMDS